MMPMSFRGYNKTCQRQKKLIFFLILKIILKPQNYDLISLDKVILYHPQTNKPTPRVVTLKILDAVVVFSPEAK